MPPHGFLLIDTVDNEKYIFCWFLIFSNFCFLCCFFYLLCWPGSCNCNLMFFFMSFRPWRDFLDLFTFIYSTSRLMKVWTICFQKRIPILHNKVARFIQQKQKFYKNLYSINRTKNPGLDQKWSTLDQKWLDQIWSTLDQKWSNHKSQVGPDLVHPGPLLVQPENAWRNWYS